MSLYLVDSNFFIQAHRAYYPLDVIASFWSKVSQLAAEDKIKSIDKVKAEIYDNSSHEDELKAWCQVNLPEEFFLNSSNSIGNYAQIARWAHSMSHHYHKNAIDEFLEANLADSWLVAYAIGQPITIVTYEKSEPGIKRKIKIPEVCNQFGVRYINTIEMLRELKEVI
jgi:hypothetical protein